MGIEVLIAGLQVGIPWHVILRRIDGSPLGVGIAFLGVLHFPAAPIDRQAGVSSSGIELNFMEKCSLTTTMQVQQTGQLLRPFRKSEEAGHPSRFVLERADVVGDVAVDNVVLLPLAHDLGIEWFLPGIVVCPQFCNGAGGIWFVGRCRCDQQGGEAQQDVHEAVVHDVVLLEIVASSDVTDPRSTVD